MFLSVVLFGDWDVPSLEACVNYSSGVARPRSPVLAFPSALTLTKKSRAVDWEKALAITETS